MKLYSEGKNYKLYHGNMLDMLNVIEPNSIDSIVTDPPYELGFMGKSWDKTGIAFQQETWEKCFKALKPGGYLLAFGGSRTFHRIACAIEDAGFEIRDTIMWIYGEGFPKSMNVGKQLEKRLEDEKTKQKTEHDVRLMWERDLQKTKRNEKKQDEVLQSQLQEQSLQGPMYGEKSKESKLWREEPCLEGWNNIQKTERELQRCKVCEMSKRVFINGEERWLCNGTQISDGKTSREMFEQSGSCPSYRPQPEQQQDRKSNAIQEQCRTQEGREIIEKWKGWGTQLKPSYEPIIVARKPVENTIIDNIMKYGVGGINIDECRVGNETISIHNAPKGTFAGGEYGRGSDTSSYRDSTGRFPANTILTYDESDFDEVCGGFPNTSPTKKHGGDGASLDTRNNGWGFKRMPCNIEDDGGSASRYFMNCPMDDEDYQDLRRYFYSAKASKRDRDEGLEDFTETTDKAKGNGLGRVCEFCGAPQLKPELCKCKVKSWVLPPKKNTHPTVKPHSLMQYLVRLVTPKGGVILDPFNGSGSTGKAVMLENTERDANYKYIGIELTEEYLPIAKARIEYAKTKKQVVEKKPKKAKEKKGNKLF